MVIKLNFTLMKEFPSGSSFYKGKGLKTLILHVPPKCQRIIKEQAKKRGISAQKFVVDLLCKAILKYK